MLSELQAEIAKLVSGAAGETGFALAGGGALIMLGVVDRMTRDLDFFTEHPAVVKPTADSVERALVEAGFETKRLIDTAGFVRLEVVRGTELCEIDLGHDARRWPPRQELLGPTIALEELAADKTLAVVGRAAPRDFVDTRALAEIFGNDRLCELAADKDLGFSRRHLAEALDKIDRLGRDRFEVDDRRYEELRIWALGWRDALLEQTRQLGRDRGLGRERDVGGPGIGL